MQNLISVLRDYGEDNQNILQQLKQKYDNTFSDKQLGFLEAKLIF